MCNWARVDKRCSRTGRINTEYEREDCLSFDCKDSWFYRPGGRPSRFREHISENPCYDQLENPALQPRSWFSPPSSSGGSLEVPPPPRRPRKLQKRQRRRPVPEEEPQPDTSSASLPDSQATVVGDGRGDDHIHEVRDRNSRDKGKGKAKDDDNDKDEEEEEEKKEESTIKVVLKLPKVGVEIMAGLVSSLVSKIPLPSLPLPPLMRRMPSLPPMPPLATLKEVGKAVGNWTGVGYIWRGLSGLAPREPLRPFSFFSSPFKWKRS